MADPTLRVGRTRFVRTASRLGHERLLRLERLRRRNPLVRAAAAPLRWWLRRGSMRVGGGPAEGLRLSMRHLPLAHAHTGLLARGWLEVSVQEAMRRLLAEGDVFYDVGANVGFFALLGARFVGPAGRVYAFEPVPESAEATRANADLNGLPNVSVVQTAVGAAAGRDRLLLVEDLSWSHLESLGAHPRAQGALEVDVVAIDDLVRDGAIDPPALVKIDVEGSELAVLEGMRETIERHRPAIVCELHETSDEFVAAMEALGYVTSNLEGKVALREAPPSVHALAVPG